MTMRTILLAVALLALAAAADAQDKPPEHSNQPPTADSQEGDAARPKDYGYGEQPGDEAGKGSARQASDPDRPKSKTPQDQRPEPGKRTAERGTARAVAGQVVKASSQSVQVRGKDRKVQTLLVTPETIVLRDGAKIDATRLQPGDEVRAAIEHRGNRTVATRITVETGDPAMQQGRQPGESVDTPDQAREGIGGHIENTHPEPQHGQDGSAPATKP